MNAILKDVIAYTLKHYKKKSEASNVRITKMIYLSDWHQAINYRKQITNITWYFDTYGPYVKDIKNEIATYPELFDEEKLMNETGQMKTFFALLNKNYRPELTEEQIKSIDHVIKVTKDLRWGEFITLVYSTYPILTSEKYTNLNLIEKAKEYAKLK